MQALVLLPPFCRNICLRLHARDMELFKTTQGTGEKLFKTTQRTGENCLRLHARKRGKLFNTTQGTGGKLFKAIHRKIL